MHTGLRALLATALVPLTAAAAEAAPDSTGGWSAADRHYDRAAMARARSHSQAHHGAGTIGFAHADRFEYRSNEGESLVAFDGGAWWGTDTDRLRLRLVGEYETGDARFDSAEIHLLWSHAMTRYFDAEAGLRHDAAPGDDRTWLAVGLRGLAPQWLELEVTAFASEDGDLASRVEVEYDLLLTQRLILGARGELDVSFDDVPGHDTGRGVSRAEAGLRLRYEVRRTFAPYLGVSWERAYGDTADYLVDSGRESSSVSFVAGLRVWF